MSTAADYAAAEFTAEQEVALSFAWLVARDPQWRTLNWRRLSFTDPEWAPLNQLYGSVRAGVARLEIRPGNRAGLGFVARTNADGTVNVQDAQRRRNQWVILLSPDGTDPDDPRPVPVAAPVT